MKIAHFVSGFPVPSETFVLDEIEAFSRIGAANSVVAIRPSPNREVSPPPGIEKILYGRPSFPAALGSFAKAISRRELVRFPNESVRNLYLLSIAPYLVRQLKEWGADHCHAHFAHYPATLAFLCARELGIGFSFNAHSYDLFHYRSLLGEKVSDSNWAFPISDLNRDYLLGASVSGKSNAEKVRTFRCGIDLSRYPFREISDSADPAPLILGVGRLVDTKGFATLVEAIPDVLPEFPALRVAIVGEGPERERLQTRISQLALSDRVELLGSLDRDSTRSKQAEASVVVQPCCEGKNGLDGIPVVLMEAMALGTPVISTRFAAIPELIEDRTSGILVEPENTQELAEAIRVQLRDRSSASRMAKEARRWVEENYDGPTNYERKARLVMEGGPEGGC